MSEVRDYGLHQAIRLTPRSIAGALVAVAVVVGLFVGGFAIFAHASGPTTYHALDPGERSRYELCVSESEIGANGATFAWDANGEGTCTE